MPHLSWNEVRDRAIRFSREHAGDRSESAEKQTFWNDFFNVFGLRRASLASFEANVTNLKGNKGAIDLLWKGRLLVEHKSFGEDLGLAETQAFTYIEDLTRANRWEEIPRFVLVSDFAHFVLYDLEPEEQRDLPLFAGRKIEPHHFTLADFPKHVRHFAFMLGQTRVRLDPEDPANQKAYDRMCELHDALKKGGFTGHDLERLLVRVLFCLFAEDTTIFQPDTFTQFIRTQTREDGSDCGARLLELCDWLNNPASDGTLEDTDPFYGFRYVNGGLFAERLGFPRFNRDMRKALLDCCDFQWARISPAVFGSLFQGVLDDKSRRQQGAHYTSERDIMKVLRSLFLDELRADWERMKADRSTRRRLALEGFHQRLRDLQFLDPACGCGNFLVLAYRELRELEMDVVRELAAGTGGQQLLPIVNVDQFHGIEYSEWPVRIAEVALWLMDHQMNQQAGEVFGQPMDRLPLTTSPHIVPGNALRTDWNAVLPAAQCSYVLGNPPFVGKKARNAEQQADMELAWGGVKGAGVLDYVTCWYVKAARYITGADSGRPAMREGSASGSAGVPPAGSRVSREPSESRETSDSQPTPNDARSVPRDAEHGRRDARATRDIRVAFVSTNSISQGEQVGILWGELFQRYRLKIHFAHRTFAWGSEARGKAHVHVVIIGFGAHDRTGKRIFDYEADPAAPTETIATNISPYLVEGNDVCVMKRTRPFADVPELVFGSMPNDGGHLMLTDAEREALLAEEPQAAQYIRPLLGSEEFINGIARWCLWFKDAPPGALRSMPAVMRRVEAVRAHRKASPRGTTNELAATPSLFGEDRQPSVEYLAIPSISSERRNYIPMAFLPPELIGNNKLLLLPGATAFHFGVLTSAMHMTWVRQVTGRLESRYQYSVKLVYNNYPWPTPTPGQRARVEKAARAVLAARAAFMGSAGVPPAGSGVPREPSESRETSDSQPTPNDARNVPRDAEHGRRDARATLADLYDPLTMPAALAKAHADLDRAVERCYRAEPFRSDRERVEHLFRLYEQLTAPLLPATKVPGRRRAR